jgi:hypothetical protein
MAAVYDYLFLSLARAPTPHLALADHLKAAGAALDAQGGEIVGQFAPQLGWANTDAAVLVRWRGGVRGDGDPLSASSAIVETRIDPLTPTIRPADDARPAGGGIYVHRWFEIEAGAADEFIELSGQGWERFEATFDTQIFGLFRREPTDADRASGVVRLLLLTRYADHGVWEASRDPTTEAMQIFARRQQLTRRSWAASSRFVAAP